jgi:hypothetical protein
MYLMNLHGWKRQWLDTEGLFITHTFGKRFKGEKSTRQEIAICDSQNRDFKEYCLLRSEAFWTGTNLSVFWRNFQLPSLLCESKPL